MLSPLNILLLGNGAGALAVMRQLAGTPHQPKLVYTNLRSPMNGLKALAERHGSLVLHEKDIRNPATAARMKLEEIDVLLCVRSLCIVPDFVIDSVRMLALNLHSALLPDYAGRNTISWSIHNGETEHGATLHVMDKDVDTGDIVAQVRFPLDPLDTGASVTRKTIRSAVPMVLQVLDSLARQGPAGLERRAQDLRRRRYYLKEIPDEGWIRWTRSALEIDRQLRASNFHPFPSPWGTPRTCLDANLLHVLSATPLAEHALDLPPGRVGPVDTQGALVATGHGCLRVETLLENGEQLAASDLLQTGQQLDSPPV